MLFEKRQARKEKHEKQNEMHDLREHRFQSLQNHARTYYVNLRDLWRKPHDRRQLG